MKKTNWIRYWEIMRYYGFDLARIFPILIKHEGIANFINGINSHLEAMHAYVRLLYSLEYQLILLIPGNSPAWMYLLN